MRNFSICFLLYGIDVYRHNRLNSQAFIISWGRFKNVRMNCNLYGALGQCLRHVFKGKLLIVSWSPNSVLGFQIYIAGVFEFLTKSVALNQEKKHLSFPLLDLRPNTSPIKEKSEPAVDRVSKVLYFHLGKEVVRIR